MRYKKFRMKCVALPFYLGVALLLVNQRVGWEDSGGPQLLAFALRSDIWILLGVVVTLAIAPRWAPIPMAYKKIYREILVISPIAFLLCSLFASVLSKVSTGLFIDIFGLADLAKIILSMSIGIVVFNLTLSYEGFASRLIQILTWAPLANVLIGIFAVTTSVNSLQGFNDISAEGRGGAGFIGVGGRFQGLGSNANLAMIQTAIGLALLVPQVTNSVASPFWKRMLFIVYGIALCIVMAWTGVRATLIIWPVMFAMLFWLQYRPSKTNLTGNIFLLLKIGLFVILGSLITDALDMHQTLIERLQGGDGRLFLWERYSKLLIENPLGIGFGFDSIAQTDSIIDGQRLPPHNALLQAGMYAGVFGVLISLFLILRVVGLIIRIKLSSRKLDISPEITGLILAWTSLIIAVMFAGLLNADYNFATLTALLLGLAARSDAAALTSRKRNIRLVELAMHGSK